MRLDDLIEEHTIESIAKKTNLAEKVITKLFDKEFKAMNFSQAMGVLTIIEREYNVDLDALRQECKDYFADHGSPEKETVALAPIKKERRAIPRLLAFVFLMILAYGAWYFFAEYYSQKILPIGSKSEKSLIDTILQGKDTASKDVKKDTTTKSNLPDDGSGVIAGDAAVTDSSDKTMVQQGTEANQSERTDTSEAVIDGEDAESNKSRLSTISETAIGEQNSTVATVGTSEAAEANNSAEQVPVVLEREMMTLLPQEMMWFRLTNLDTKKRKTYKQKNKHEIDLREHDWLFATEDAYFAIIDKDRFEEFSGEGKLFFRLDQKGIHQLSETEYRAVEK